MTFHPRRDRIRHPVAHFLSAGAAALLLAASLPAVALPAGTAREADIASSAQARACLQGTSHQERAWCMRQAAVQPATPRSTPKPTRWAPSAQPPAAAHTEPS
jgi:hypothetical protein